MARVGGKTLRHELGGEELLCFGISRNVRQKSGNNFMNACRCGKIDKPDEGRKEKQLVRYFVTYNGTNSQNRCFKVSYFPFF